MRRGFLLPVLFLLLVSLHLPKTLRSQSGKTDSCDLIIMRDGNEVKGKVLVISPDDVRYKKCDMPDGPDFVVRKRDVFMIEFKNGTREVFKEEAREAPVYSQSREDSIKKATRRLMYWLPVYPGNTMPMFFPRF
jgi:hypothetical protein